MYGLQVMVMPPNWFSEEHIRTNVTLSGYVLCCKALGQWPANQYCQHLRDPEMHNVHSSDHSALEQRRSVVTHCLD